MRNILIMSLLSFFVTGCASQKYGDFVKLENSPLVEYVGNDVAKRLLSIYPVGKTTLKFDPETLGIMGVSIEDKLRDSGFAISYSDGVPVDYVFDALDERIYRLTMIIDGVKLSKLYSKDTNGLRPASAWTVVEK